MVGIDTSVSQISKAEVKSTMKERKGGNAIGHDNIPTVVWTCFGELNS